MIGTLIFWVVIIVYAYRSLKGSLSPQKKDGSPSRHDPDSAARRMKQKAGRMKARGSFAADHGTCQHVKTEDGISQFEDRRHDWLARQMEEERRKKDMML